MRTGSGSTLEDQTCSTSHHRTVTVLPTQYLFPLPMGMAMASPLSSIIANMYMEHFKQKGLRTAENSQMLWRFFVDDTFIVKQIENTENYLKHINSIDQSIKFTVADHTQIVPSFLDTLVTTEPNRILSVRVCRKPTHMDRYLHFNSPHNIGDKHSIINTLHHRAKTISSTPDLL